MFVFPTWLARARCRAFRTHLRLKWVHRLAYLPRRLLQGFLARATLVAQPRGPCAPTVGYPPSVPAPQTPRILPLVDPCASWVSVAPLGMRSPSARRWAEPAALFSSVMQAGPSSCCRRFIVGLRLRPAAFGRNVYIFAPSCRARLRWSLVLAYAPPGFDRFACQARGSVCGCSYRLGGWVGGWVVILSWLSHQGCGEHASIVLLLAASRILGGTMCAQWVHFLRI